MLPSLLVALLLPAQAFACWSSEDIAVNKQLQSAHLWAIVQIRALTEEPLRSARPRTRAEFDFVNINGERLGSDSIWFKGAKSGGDIASTAPDFEVGRFYVVLLVTGEDAGFSLLHEAASAFRIEQLMDGVLSPWDSVHFTRGNNFVPRDHARSVSDAQLHQVVDAFSDLNPDASLLERSEP